MNEYITFILAAIAAGEVWNNAGYFNDWVNNRNDPNWKGFDKKAFRNDLIVGGLLGIGIVIYQAIVPQGTPGAITIPTITDAQGFIVAVAALFGPVAVVDKVLVGGFGRLFSARKPQTPPTTSK